MRNYIPNELAKLRLQVAGLEKALSNLGMAQCYRCNSWHGPKDPDLMMTSRGGVCVDCIAFDEDALEDVKVSDHDLNRMVWHLDCMWFASATVDGLRTISGSLVANEKRSRLVENHASRAWNASIVLWDFLESKGRKPKQPTTGRDLFHDPRAFTPNEGLLYSRQFLNVARVSA
jgi:hypothetical protein